MTALGDYNTMGAAQNALRAAPDRRSVVDALVKGLADSETRSKAIGLLGELGDSSHVKTIKAYVKDKDSGTRGAAVGALGALKYFDELDLYVTALGDYNTMGPAQIALRAAPDKKRVASALRDAMKDEKTRDRCIVLLAELDLEKDVSTLAGWLRNSSTREAAQKALIRADDKAGVVGALLPLVRDTKDASACGLAIETLSLMRIFKDPSPFIAALKSQNVEIRMQAATALGRMRDAQAIPALIDALGAESRKKRARWALGRFDRDKPLIDALSGALREHKNTQVREACAQLLGSYMRAEALAPLRLALKDPEKTVVEAAKKAIESIEAG